MLAIVALHLSLLLIVQSQMLTKHIFRNSIKGNHSTAAGFSSPDDSRTEQYLSTSERITPSR